MKVLWLTNMPLPEISQKIGSIHSPKGGWMVGLSDALREDEQVDLTIVFPQKIENEIISGSIDNIKFYGFYNSKNLWKYDYNIEKQLSLILSDAKPDIVHIFGTEFTHSLAMTKVFNSPDKTLISIQGLVSVIADHYMACLPPKIQTRFTLRDFLKLDNIEFQQSKFRKRGRYEIEALKSVKHVLGRTTWDKACVQHINANAKYHFCNEILRSEFYKHRWDINKCDRYTIFISQAQYPIKGLHFMLEAMPQILKRFPKTRLYIGGTDITKSKTLKEKIKITSYGKYIKDIISKKGLNDKVIFTGMLDEESICDMFIKSHVFVSASIIENESNSLSEAKLLGLPCVSSYVGGVIDRITHNENGFLYQADAPYMLAYYINQIFENDDLALKLSQNAREHAVKIHDKSYNKNTLIKIYNDILNN